MEARYQVDGKNYFNGSDCGVAIRPYGRIRVDGWEDVILAKDVPVYVSQLLSGRLGHYTTGGK